MARYNFSKTIVHSGLNKTKTIYGNDENKLKLIRVIIT